MRLALNLFHDFHLHGASAPEWNQRYLQISQGTMRSRLAEATAGNVHVFRKWMSERVVQQGCLPAGKVCFAIPHGRSSETPRMNGRELRHDTLFVLRGGEEFTLQRPRDMELLAVTFEGDDFLGRAEMRNWLASTRSLLSRPALQADLVLLQRLKRDLLAILAEPSLDERCFSAEHADDAVPGMVFEALSDLFSDAAGAGQTFGSASASFVVAECHRIVAASGHTPPNIEALCTRLRTSRRNLQNSFRLVANTTPVHYLRSLRLNAVRKRLMTTRALELNVAQAATDQGFSHLSHFTERYKHLFGELPSQTPRQGRPDSWS